MKEYDMLWILKKVQAIGELLSDVNTGLIQILEIVSQALREHKEEA